MLDSYCRFLRAHGYGIKRCNLVSDTVHPQMKTTRHVWFSEQTDPGAMNPMVVVRRKQYQLGEAMIETSVSAASNVRVNPVERQAPGLVAIEPLIHEMAQIPSRL